MRAFVAVALMVAFYALAIAAVVGLVHLGWYTGELALESLRGKLLIIALVAAAGAFVAAAVIAWSVLPRIDRFEPPGPELREADCRELFENIHDLARQVEQEVPRHVYLVGDVNAFVTERGGIMGLGSRRVMGIGLPLLGMLTVSELRAVLAHEMGHFHSGDTKLGPWIYKTRGAIGRTVDNLIRAREATAEDVQTIAFILAAVQKPFLWFGTAFLRITQAISRGQEYVADALSGRLVGSEAAISTLQRVHAGAAAYQSFMGGEVAGALDAGYRPPLLEGFTRFLAHDELKPMLEKVVQAEMDDPERDPYDSHPPLRDRVEALRRLAAPPRERDDRPASVLCGDPARLEAALFDPALKPIAWSQMIELVYRPQWTASARAFGARFGERTVAGAPREPGALRAALVAEHGEDAASATDEQVRRFFGARLGSALTILLLERGFEATASVGEPVRLLGPGGPVEPFAEASRYLAGETTDEAWIERWRGVGIADLAFEAPLARAV